jgi:LPXTG-motif cell wall-anchored protein
MSVQELIPTVIVIGLIALIAVLIVRKRRER